MDKRYFFTVSEKNKEMAEKIMLQILQDVDGGAIISSDEKTPWQFLVLSDINITEFKKVKGAFVIQQLPAKSTITAFSQVPVTFKQFAENLKGGF